MADTTEKEKSLYDPNPNQRLCSVLLNEYNYLSWSRAINLALGSRSKLSFSNGKNGTLDADTPEYSSWLAQDQLVMSWLLNSMEPKLSEIFSYSDSSYHLWKSVKDMYGDMNNAARVFQLKKDIAEIHQGNLSFIQHLGNLKAKWNELDMYRPHTTDATVLLKRSEEDKVFQLLASLGAEYEDLKSHLLMTPELPNFQMVCNAIQREEVRKKVMNAGVVANNHESNVSENRAFAATRPYRGKRPDLKCSHCTKIGRLGIGHVQDKCWILHPELKPKFNEDGTFVKKQSYNIRANLVDNKPPSEEQVDFSSNPLNIINEFVTRCRLRAK